MTKGFLLIQMSIVIALLLLIMTLSLPHFSFLQRQLIRSEIEKMYSLLYYFQQRAITTAQDQTIVFNTQANSYSCNEYTVTLPQALRFGFLPKTFGPPSHPKTLVTKPITFANNKLTFNADGSIRPGTIYLTDKQNRFMYALSVPVGHVPYLRKYRFSSQWDLL